MPRTVFFSFHYQRDIFRVQQIKHHYITKDSYTEAGFFDGSLEEKARKHGDAVVKKLIDDGMSGSSVLCVLIGKETYQRRWVDYEILHAISRGMGVFGITIHKLKHPRKWEADFADGTDNLGSNPFSYLKYVDNGAKLQPKINYSKTGWTDAPYQATIPSAYAPSYLRAPFGLISSLMIGDRDVQLQSILKVHDWVIDDGYNNFGTWVEAAAKQAGK
jgi:hypothetical protein